MKIKQKLFVGIGALFILVTLLSILSGFYITKLSGDIKNILVANYNSVAYSREMLLALDEIQTDSSAYARFDASLKKQQKNVTEMGEREATNKLANKFRSLSAKSNDSLLFKEIRSNLTDVMMLNMEAIQRKSDVAQKSASEAISWVMLAGTLSFFIALVMLVNFPGGVANPIRELTASMKSIAAKNYSERVHIDNKDEFGEMADAFNIMAEKLQEYNNSNLAKLLTEKKRIETLIDNIQEPVIGLDEHKNLLFINEEALAVTNTKRADVINRPVQDLAVNNDLIRVLVKDLFLATKDREPVKIFANDRESYFQKQIIPIKITPTGETQEKHIGDVIFLKNITSYKELDFAKTNFLATVSHELKTPISSIKMSTQLLQNNGVGELNKEQKELVESIKEDALRLLKITGELLNMTQLESGKIQLQITDTDPADLIRSAVSNNFTVAEAKHIRIAANIPQQLPLVSVDGDKTVWVLNNLISNAVRHSYEYATVEVDAGIDEKFVTISVTDTGQGIAPQYVHKIFDRYFRIPGSKKEGTGLGLAISRELLEQQGGKIDVQSEMGAGSVFRIYLPVSA